MTDEMGFQYYYGTEAEQFNFIRIPKAFFTNKRFSVITYGAKILYGILLDRMSLSVKNKWLDSSNRVFIYFTIDSIQKDLNCSRPTAVSLLRELEQIGLVEKRRQPNKPTILYVKNFIKTVQEAKKEEKDIGSKKFELPDMEVKDVNYRKLKTFTSGSNNNLLPEVKKINSNNTEFNNTESYISSSTKLMPEDQEEKMNEDEILKVSIQKFDLKWNMIDLVVPEELKRNINYILLELYKNQPPKNYNIGGVLKDGMEVQHKIFAIINTNNYLFVAKTVLNNPNPIYNLHAFVITCFFNIATGATHTRMLGDTLQKELSNNKYNFEELEKEILANY